MYNRRRSLSNDLPHLVTINPYASPGEQRLVEPLIMTESEPRHIVVSIIGWTFAVVGTAVMALTAFVTFAAWTIENELIIGLSLGGAFFLAYFGGIAFALIVLSGGWGKRIHPIYVMPAINGTLFWIAMITFGAIVVCTRNL